MTRHSAIRRTPRASGRWSRRVSCWLLVHCLVAFAATFGATVGLAGEASAEGTAEATITSPVQKGDTTEQSVCRSFRVREQDQIWLVSTRHLGCSLGGKYLPTYQIWLYEKGTWQPKTEADFFAADSADVVTSIYIHGNRLNANESSSFGLSFYFEFVGKLDQEPPVRFVIWSWPSDSIRGPLKDVQSKAARSDYESYYLACFLAKMKPELRVGLLGYSFGARIACGALHLTNGGSIFGNRIAAGERPQFRVALWAAAEHNYWWQPGQFHSAAPAAADAWFVTVNGCDSILGRYRFVDACGNPEAMGYSGIYGRNLLPPDVNARIEEVNVANIIGDSHDWRSYLYSLWIQNRTRDYILWHELGSSSVASSAKRPMASVAE